MGLFLTIFGDVVRTLTVYRRPAGSRVKGRVLEAAEASFSISATVQPATPEDLEVLPEGTRTDAVLVFHTEDELRDGASPDGAPPDEVEDDGERWVIHHVGPWQEWGDFYRALGIKVGQ